MNIAIRSKPILVAIVGLLAFTVVLGNEVYVGEVDPDHHFAVSHTDEKSETIEAKKRCTQDNSLWFPPYPNAPIFFQLPSTNERPATPEQDLPSNIAYCFDPVTGMWLVIIFFVVVSAGVFLIRLKTGWLTSHYPGHKDALKLARKNSSGYSPEHLRILLESKEKLEAHKKKLEKEAKKKR